MSDMYDDEELLGDYTSELTSTLNPLLCTCGHYKVNHKRGGICTSRFCECDKFRKDEP